METGFPAIPLSASALEALHHAAQALALAAHDLLHHVAGGLVLFDEEVDLLHRYEPVPRRPVVQLLQAYGRTLLLYVPPTIRGIVVESDSTGSRYRSLYQRICYET